MYSCTVNSYDTVRCLKIHTSRIVLSLPRRDRSNDMPFHAYQRQKLVLYSGFSCFRNHLLTSLYHTNDNIAFLAMHVRRVQLVPNVHQQQAPTTPDLSL